MRVREALCMFLLVVAHASDKIRYNLVEAFDWEPAGPEDSHYEFNKFSRLRHSRLLGFYRNRS